MTGAPFDGRRFRNEDPRADRSLRDVLKWAATRKPSAWPVWVDENVPYRPRVPQPGEILLTFVNHSTFLIQHADRSVLTDPHWSHRASPVQWAGPARVHAPGIPFEGLPHVDVVLVSHSHYDHMDLPTLRRLRRRFGARVVTTLGNASFLERRGVEGATELDWWGADDGITAVPAQHFAARTPFDRNRTLWAGFVIHLGDRRIYFAGDSGYSTHFARIGAQLGPLHASLVPIGAYEPRWFMSANHMNPDEAVRAHLDLRSPLSVAMHFGCFQLTDEPIDEPAGQLRAALERHRVPASTFRLLRPGETLAI